MASQAAHLQELIGDFINVEKGGLLANPSNNGMWEGTWEPHDLVLFISSSS